MKTFVSIFALSAFCALSSAQNLIVTGALTGTDPTFNRLFDATQLSGNGIAVHYDTYTFRVSATGTYSAEMLATDAAPFDPYLYVYSAFNPTNALTGLVNGDDDYSGTLPILGTSTNSVSAASRIVSGDSTNYLPGGLSLTAGTTYVAVATAFLNVGLGNYALGIGGGPGTVTQVVPEPSAFVALGCGATALLRRRRRA